ncbi:MAG: GGDEF domain-containing protein [Acidimicrobiia bacterium]|nr:GGDEF domain-containing protein [Acidimicrobiia bacterium]
MVSAAGHDQPLASSQLHGAVVLAIAVTAWNRGPTGGPDEGPTDSQNRAVGRWSGMSSPPPVLAFPTRGWADVSTDIDGALRKESGLVGVALIDVDHFIELSRQLPPTSGGTEAIMAAVVRRLGTRLTPADLTARVADDSVLVMRHPLEGPAAIEGLGLRLVDACREPLVVAGESYRCTISVGVATSRAGDTGPSLLRFAQFALDDAKALGRNRMVAFADEDRELLE